MARSRLRRARRIRHLPLRLCRDEWMRAARASSLECQERNTRRPRLAHPRIVNVLALIPGTHQLERAK
eukprot:scaffold33535_cov29-Tisochrysis_lutea.AAC.2